MFYSDQHASLHNWKAAIYDYIIFWFFWDSCLFQYDFLVHCRAFDSVGKTSVRQWLPPRERLWEHWAHAKEGNNTDGNPEINDVFDGELFWT